MTANPTPLVLVVESDPVQRDLMQMMLKRIGCDVEITREPQQVSAILIKQHPSLLIIDTFIPGSSGLEIIIDLNQKKLLKHTSVLFVSAYGFPDIIQKAKDNGVNEFLMKPINADIFTMRVKALLQI
jgi:PleD family two-component response regulator